jgi:hypothetical protein
LKSIFLTSSHWRAILLIRTVWTFRRSITSPRHVHVRTVLTAEMIRTTRWWNCRKNKSILYTCSLGLSTKTSILVQPTKVQQTSFKVTLSQLRPFAHTKNFCSVFFLRILSYNPGQNSSGHLIQFCKNPNEQLKLDFTRVSPTPLLQCCIFATSIIMKNLEKRHSKPISVGCPQRFGQDCLKKDGRQEVLFNIWSNWCDYWCNLCILRFLLEMHACNDPLPACLYFPNIVSTWSIRNYANTERRLALSRHVIVMATR